ENGALPPFAAAAVPTPLPITLVSAPMRNVWVNDAPAPLPPTIVIESGPSDLTVPSDRIADAVTDPPSATRGTTRTIDARGIPDGEQVSEPGPGLARRLELTRLGGGAARLDLRGGVDREGHRRAVDDDGQRAAAHLRDDAARSLVILRERDR